MEIDENKAKVKWLYEEVVSTGKLELADKCVSLEAVENEEVNTSGLDSFKQFYTQFRNAFPDLTFKVEDMIAEGDKVVARMTVRGTHNGDGEFMGFTPGGNKIEVETIDIIRFEDGMMVEHWGKSDTLGMIQQLKEPITGETISNIRSAP